MTIASPSATRTPKHDAVRDDLAIAGQISWFPPRPSLRGADAAGPTRVSKAPHAGDVARQTQTPDRRGQHVRRIARMSKRVPAGTSVAHARP